MKIRICKTCGKRKTEGTVCDICHEFYCFDHDEFHLIDVHTTHWEAEEVLK